MIVPLKTLSTGVLEWTDDDRLLLYALLYVQNISGALMVNLLTITIPATVYITVDYCKES